MTKSTNTAMRTTKHRLLVADDATAMAMVEYFYAYQTARLYFSRSLNDASFNDSINFKNGYSYIDVRNHFMKQGRLEWDTPLTARMWKNALEEAYLLQERTFAGALLRVKNRLNAYVYNHSLFHTLSDDERHSLMLINFVIAKTGKYLKLEQLWREHGIIEGFKQFLSLHVKKAKFPPVLNISTYANKVRALCKKHIKQTNVNNLAAVYQPTISLDENCYTIKSVYDANSKKYTHHLTLVNFDGQKRFAGITLSGYHHIANFSKMGYSKSLTISFDYEIKNGLCKPVFYLHLGFDVKPNKVKSLSKPTQPKADKTNILAADWGTTELFTFSNGDVFYPNNGLFYKNCADKQLELQRVLSNIELKRRENKRPIEYGIYQLVANTDPSNYLATKAKSNQDFKKLTRQIQQYQASQAKNLADYLIANQVDVLVYENNDINLMNKNGEQRNRNRHFKRSLNLMTLHDFIEQVSDKTKLYHPRFTAVAINPAYSSQTCPACGFVDNRSRNGDGFCCVACGHVPQPTASCQVIPPKDGTQASQSDYAAAVNLLNRYMCVDALLGINNHTPKQKVKVKLLQLYEITKKLAISYDSVLLDQSKRAAVKIHLDSQILT